MKITPFSQPLFVFVWVTLISLITTANAVAPNAATSTTTLKVLSWNIQFGQGTDGITNYDRIAAWLARMDPDLIALCEVPQDQVSTLVNLLGQKTGRTWSSHFVPKFVGSPEGNLILSKYSFTSVGSRYLSYQRSIAHATVNVAGRSINIFATHLDHTSSALRLVQAEELIGWTAGFAAPRIVAGDLNAGNDTPELLRLLNTYRDSWVDSLSLGTALAYLDNPAWLNTRTRRWRIDFILYAAEQIVLSAKGSNIPDIRDLSNPNVVITLGTPDDKGVRPSDHNLVVTNFEVFGEVTPTPTPAAPVLSTQPNTNRAIALHSVLFTSEPFSVRSPLNFSNDLRTRIILFATNLELQPGETPSVVTVTAVDNRGISYQLPVEQIVKVPNLGWLSEVIVKSPEDQTINGDLSVSLGLRGMFSNTVLVEVRGP